MCPSDSLTMIFIGIERNSAEKFNYLVVEFHNQTKENSCFHLMHFLREKGANKHLNVWGIYLNIYCKKNVFENIL